MSIHGIWLRLITRRVLKLLFCIMSWKNILFKLLSLPPPPPPPPPPMWSLWLNWLKSTLYPVTAPNDSKCWPIVTTPSIQEPVASNCDVTMTDCSRVVAMDAFLAQWCWGQWFYFVTPVFQHGASLVIIIIIISSHCCMIKNNDTIFYTDP